MKQPAVALIDGEHYPAVVVDALHRVGGRFEFKAALFVGGSEKIDAEGLEAAAASVYGLPVLFDSDPARGLGRLIEGFNPEVVVDLSDEPVLGYEQRFRLVSHSLARNVGYVGSDFHFSPVTSDRLCICPSISIIGTAKRVGKTAISGYVARVLQGVVTGEEGHPGVVVVAMGRGGPAEPEVIDGANIELTVEDLVARSREGRHAASDHFEDAVLSRLVTVGCRRCGGGLAGEPFVSNVAAGIRLANSLGPSLMILEGSGGALPPIGTDARLLVSGADRPVEHIAGYLGAYRLLVSDALMLTMAEEPLASREKVRAVIEAVSEIKPDMETIPVVFRPRPAQSVQGRRVSFFSTAPAAQEALLSRYLEENHGCRVEMFSGNLSDRAALRADLERSQMARADMVLTEIKGAAIDVVAEEAVKRGLEVVFVDNLPVEVDPAQKGRLSEIAEELGRVAKERFERRT
jgi:cyclic 2,3-diphosphoglycerate synthetase